MKTLSLLLLVSSLVQASTDARANFELLTGAWIPTGNAGLLGVHPVLGINMTAKRRSFGWRLEFEGRFLDSKEAFVISNGAESITTRDLFSGYFGLVGEADFVQRTNLEAGLMAGVGVDFLNSEKLGGKVHGVGGFSPMLGLFTTIYLGKGIYLKPQVKYNFVDYDNAPGTNLAGNTISSILAIGYGRQMGYNTTTRVRRE